MPIGIYEHKKHTKERSQKISKALTGRKLSLETRKKMSLSKKGIPPSPSASFKKGNIPWNKKEIRKRKRNWIRVGGIPMLKAPHIYMEYHNLDKIPKGFVIHHIDENLLNDDITNLRLMRKEDHHFLHNMLDKERYNFRSAVKRLKDEIKIIKKDYRMGTVKTCNVIKLKIDEIMGDDLI